MIMLSLFGIGFEMPILLYLIVPAVLAFIYVNRDLLLKKKRKRKLHLVAIRSAAIVALLFVLAMPHIIREDSILQETTSVLIIDDSTDSMSLYGGSIGSQAVELIEARIEGVSRVELRNLSTSNYTGLGDAIYQGILGSSLKNNVIILVSDGNSNHGMGVIDVAAFAAETNTQIFPVVPTLVGSEVHIGGVVGAEKTPVNSKYAGRVVIEKVGAEASYNLRVFVDEQKIFETPVIQSTPVKEFSFEHVFNTKGPHNITVRIFPESDDVFAQNNVFSKIVNVIERPRILLVSSAGSTPLRQVLEEFYDVDVEDMVPKSLGRYDGVVLENQPAKSIRHQDVVREFLNDGGGLLVVGGNNSYNDGGYYESDFENLLPVRSSEAPSKKGEQMNVVILLDISGSTGATMAGNTKIDVEKAIAVKMVRDLKMAHIGVVAFNSDAFVIQQIHKMEDTGALEDKISRLRFGGGTYVLVGLIKARDMLRSVQGSRYIIVISDGVTNYPVQSFKEATFMAADSFIIHTIGVGFDTDTSFMRGLALRGNGVYFEPSESDRVKIIFGGLEEEGGEGEGRFTMVVMDTHHFITEGIGATNISIEEFNKVTEKSSAQVLAATRDLQPLLTVWRFGLGRVASLTVDGGDEWANRLYTSGNSKLVSSTINWIIGDPDEDGELQIDCADARVGEETPIIVTSESGYPSVTLNGHQVSLSRLDEKNYFFSFYPERVGFASVASAGQSCTMAVNFQEEYSDFRINTDILAAMADITGGKIYQPDELSALANEVSDYTIEESTGVKIEKINMQLGFTLAALLLFFTDIAIRRLSEIRKDRR